MQQPWIPHPTVLKGQTIDLVPLEKDHFEELSLAASDKKLWEPVPVDCSGKETFNNAYQFALTERENGRQYPFVIVHKGTNKLIGSTRFFEIYPSDKKLEIGWTWIIQKYWATDVNFECKLLLLDFCFHILQARRVQIKTDATNLRSRRAIEKLGAQFEGILRKDRIKENGDSRNAAYYSILDNEWETARQRILTQLTAKRTAL